MRHHTKHFVAALVLLTARGHAGERVAPARLDEGAGGRAKHAVMVIPFKQ